mmetsp:Transcript_48737/g.136350  ORF Transcript_48737/g.136350 Transcript_48737/m.136350 type:complete len:317 (+) Transcript_48737:282-1232(+)
MPHGATGDAHHRGPRKHRPHGLARGVHAGAGARVPRMIVIMRGNGCWWFRIFGGGPAAHVVELLGVLIARSLLRIHPAGVAHVQHVFNQAPNPGRYRGVESEAADVPEEHPQALVVQPRVVIKCGADNREQHGESLKVFCNHRRFLKGLGEGEKLGGRQDAPDEELTQEAQVPKILFLAFRLRLIVALVAVLVGRWPQHVLEEAPAQTQQRVAKLGSNTSMVVNSGSVEVDDEARAEVGVHGREIVLLRRLAENFVRQHLDVLPQIGPTRKQFGVELFELFHGQLVQDRLQGAFHLGTRIAPLHAAPQTGGCPRSR